MSANELLRDAFMFFLATALVSVFCGVALAVGHVMSELKGGRK